QWPKSGMKAEDYQCPGSRVDSTAPLTQYCKFRNGLNDQKSEVYAYGITPKNLANFNAVSDSIFYDYLVKLSATHGSFFGRLRTGLGIEDTSKIIRQGIAKEPLVVGYGFGRHPFSEDQETSDGNIWPDRRSSTAQRPSKLVASAEPKSVSLGYSNEAADRDGLSRLASFGWVIAPSRELDDNRRTHHRLEQRALSALISVPSWWRSIRLRVSWCWRFFEDLSNIGTGNLIRNCMGKPSKVVYSLRLPGTVRDISRKLDIEVVEEPYLSTKSTQALEVGRPGRLILEGGRLWRSTRVTLDSQIANRIEVLPDMSGLIAYFDCVERPVGWPTELEKIYGSKSPGDGRGSSSSRQQFGARAAAVRVWTSEGSAEGYQVDLVPFSSEVGEIPCYVRNLERPDEGIYMGDKSKYPGYIKLVTERSEAAERILAEDSNEGHSDDAKSGDTQNGSTSPSLAGNEEGASVPEAQAVSDTGDVKEEIFQPQ
ncbi:MAG: hypothetical protein R3245_08600, partial [Kiloniellales bacterium]|nr:hypothetical protein [Kiloniellales bacterium]